MATLEEIQAELARRMGGPQVSLIDAARAELARRIDPRTAPPSQGLQPQAGEGREAYRARVEASRGIQPSAASQQMTAQAETDIQTARDQQTIGQQPVASRLASFNRGLPGVGGWVDEGVDVIGNALGYPGAGQRFNNMASAMERQHPVQSTALNIAGSVTGAIPLAIAATPSIVANAPVALGGRVMAGLGLGAATGATEGAVYGAGDDTGDGRLVNARDGAITGGLGGGTLGAIAPLAGAGLRAVLGRLQNSDVAVIASTLKISRQAAAIVRDALNAGDMQAAETALQRAGPNAMLADAGMPARQLLDASAQSGGLAGQIANDAVAQRTRDATQQMTGALDRNLGAPQGERALVDQIRTETAPARSSAYDAAYASPIDYSSTQGRAIESMMNRVPASAIRQANELMRREGLQSQQIMATIDGDTVTYQRMPDVRQLDYITRALGDVADQADGQGKLGGTTDMGRVTRNLQTAIRRNLRDAVPEYGVALDTAGDAISRRNAVEVGRNLFTMTREDVARALHDATPAERTAAQQGLRSYVDDVTARVTRTIGNPDVETREGIRLLRDFSSRQNQTNLRMLLGQETADGLIQEMDMAATAFELRAAIAEGSRTAVRQSIQSGVDQAAGQGVLRTLAAGEPINAVKRLTQALTGETAEAQQLRRMGLYEEIARALTEQRGQQAQASLRLIQRAIAGQPLNTAQANYVSTALTSGGVLQGRPIASLFQAERQGAQ